MKTFFLSLVLVTVIATCTITAVPSKDTEKCSPGETKKLDCNQCICVKGVFACTEKACPSDRHKRGVPVAADLKNTPCAPNDYFKIDCNTCYCNIDKTGYLCTENLCTYNEPTSNNTTEAVPQTISLNQTVVTSLTDNNDTNQENFKPLLVTNVTLTETVIVSNNSSNHSDSGSGTSNITLTETVTASNNSSNHSDSGSSTSNITLTETVTVSNNSNHSDSGGGTSKSQNVTNV